MSDPVDKELLREGYQEMADREKIAEIMCGQGWSRVAEPSKYIYRNRADQILALFEGIRGQERERIEREVRASKLIPQYSTVYKIIQGPKR